MNAFDRAFEFDRESGLPISKLAPNGHDIVSPVSREDNLEQIANKVALHGQLAIKYGGTPKLIQAAVHRIARDIGCRRSTGHDGSIPLKTYRPEEIVAAVENAQATRTANNLCSPGPDSPMARFMKQQNETFGFQFNSEERIAQANVEARKALENIAEPIYPEEKAFSLSQGNPLGLLKSHS